MSRYVTIDGRRHLWREVLEMRRAQREAKREQPTLVELREDRRPPGERTAGERYAAPSLFSWPDSQRASNSG